MTAASRTPPATSPPPRTSSGPATAALLQLSSLLVRDKASKAGYSRSQFGQAWSDDVDVAGGHNGCDTRNDILRRDLVGIRIKPGTNGCVVLAGTLIDPYTAGSIPFVRGEGSSEAVQIDHVVALSDAWQSGAQQLSAARRQDLANDPLNLRAVSGPINQAKSDSDAAGWLPPNVVDRCAYVTQQIKVKSSYRLWITSAERVAMVTTLAACGDVAVSTTSTMTARSAPATGRATVTTPTRAPAAIPPAAGAYYKNCTAARAAGVTPLHRGDAGYRSSMDGDGDGVACE